MRTDLNVFLNDTNETVREATFWFANNTSAVWSGNISVPQVDVTGTDSIIGMMIVQTVILVFILYSSWRRQNG